MTIAAHTLGCKLNFAETSDIVHRFEEAGWTPVTFEDKADLYVINTCTVTAIAERKGRNAIRQAVTRNANAIVAVIGCFAQNSANEISKIDGVDIILGNDRKHNLLHYVNEKLGICTPFNANNGSAFTTQYSRSDRTRTFFKIQDGCDYFCSYCAIPFARGRSRSATIAETVATAKQIAKTGTKEVVLTGINTGTFGIVHGESFLELLRQLDTVDGIERFRISSIEPNLLTDEIIDFVASSRHFLPHFHIPLQAGSNKVLKMMHRRYDTAFYDTLLRKIRSVMPDACIAADIMAGFNGEDDDEFEKTKLFVSMLPISYLHVFTFSERPNTAVLKMDGRIDVHKRRLHSRELQEISDQKRQAFYLSQQGKIRPVLWESTPHNDDNIKLMYGFTDNYIRVSAQFNPKLINTITQFKIQ